MRRMVPLLLFAALLSLLLSGCGASSRNGGPTEHSAATPELTVSSQESTLFATNNASPLLPAASPTMDGSASPAHDSGADAKLQQAAKDVVDMLRDRDLQRLEGTIDPDKGLQFSPYSNIHRKSDIVFKPEQLPTFKDAAKLIWGSYDGSGDPIELTFRDYFEKFVYDQDFADAPIVNVNKLTGAGNVKFNGDEVYPDGSFVEYHFPGFDKKNGGMDWESLVLVFRPSGSEWKLCAIVHGQWTI